MANIVAASPNVAIFGARVRLPAMGISVIRGNDHPLSTRTLKQISGHVYDVNGAPIPSANVDLFRQRDNMWIETRQTSADGTYTFPRRSDDTEAYYTVAYSVAGGAVQVHGVSDRGLVPA